MKWNKFEDYSYINDDYQLDRIGCIHTIQGVDMAYAGIIIGKDLIYRDGKLIFNKKPYVAMKYCICIAFIL